MSAPFEKHDVWMSPAMRRVANTALLDHTGAERHTTTLLQSLDRPKPNDLVLMTYEEADFLVHACAKALLAVTTLWMQGDAKDDNRRMAQQLSMVIGQLTKTNGRW